MIVALVLTFWILPGLITALTPFKYRDILGLSRDALITAFATGNVFVVLPILAERSKQILRRGTLDPSNSHSSVDIIVPTSFSFPSLGKLITLAFVLFAGWVSGAALSPTEYPKFAITGVLTFFGSTYVAIPFLMDLFRIPRDAFQFYPLLENLIHVRFGTLLAAMHILALAVLGAAAISGMFRWSVRRLARYALTTLILLVAPLIGARAFFEILAQPESGRYNVLIGMQVKDPVRATLTRDTLPESLPSAGPAGRVQQITSRGFLRVGYFSDSLPFAFVNADGQLVGFDAAMAHALARELEVELEFVLIERGSAAGMLDASIVDIIMTGLEVTPDRAGRYTLTDSYLDQTLAFVVPDHRREAFASREAVEKLGRVRVGVLPPPYYRQAIRSYVPQAEILAFASPRDFFTTRRGEAEALLYTAEAGSAWSLIYPDFTVAVPHPDVVSIPLAYAVRNGEPDFLIFVNTWINLKKKEGSVQEFFDYWILGKNAAERKPRWSVLDQLLRK